MGTGCVRGRPDFGNPSVRSAGVLGVDQVPAAEKALPPGGRSSYVAPGSGSVPAERSDWPTRLTQASQPERSCVMHRTFVLSLVLLTTLAVGLSPAWWVKGHGSIAEAASSRLPDDVPG